MKGKRLLLLCVVMLAAFFAGSPATCALGGGRTVSAAGTTVRSAYVEKEMRHIVSNIGYAAGSSGTQSRVVSIGGFTGSYGTQLKNGSLERTIYDQMVTYYVKGQKTGSLKVPCTFQFSGSGDWEKSDAYAQVEEELGYSVESAYSALLYDHPELFWVYELVYMADVSVNIEYRDVPVFKGSVSSVTISFTEIYSGASSRQAAFKDAVARAKSTIQTMRRGGTTYDLLKAIHDYLCENILYPSGYDPASSSVVPAYHSPAGVFLNGGVAACEGYAKSFMILCEEFGIPAILVVGEAGEAHMWNYVQLQGSWYAVDVTWDDVEGAPADNTYFMIGSGTAVPGGTFGTTRVMYTCFTESGSSRNFNYPILNGAAYQREAMAHAHSWVEISESEPTCTEAGSVVNRCTSCGEITRSVVAALGHSYHDKTYVYNGDATVLKDGTMSLVCDHGCGMRKFTVAAEGTKLTPTIRLNVSSLKLKTGQSTKAVKVSGLARGDSVKKWESLNTKLVKVSSSGKITAQKKTGTASIRITLASGLQRTIKVTVQAKAVTTSRISGVARSITLKKGKTEKLSPVISPITSSQKLTYKSSNTKVVTVSSSGKITAKKKGKATVTVKSGSKTIKCQITVK